MQRFFFCHHPSFGTPQMINKLSQTESILGVCVSQGREAWV